MIYDQTCASEKRRRRKKERIPGPGQARGDQRGGVRRLRRLQRAVELPVGRAAGNRVRAQAPDQPVVLQQGFLLRRPVSARASSRSKAAQLKKPKKAAAAAARRLGLPQRRCRRRRCRSIEEPYGILVTGIGGTGVVTVGQILAMAAHVEGKGVLGAGHERAGAEGRAGDVARAAGRSIRSRSAFDPGRHRRRRPGDRLRPDRHRQPRCAVAHGRGPHARGGQFDRHADRRLRQESGLAISRRPLAEHDIGGACGGERSTSSMPAGSPPR